MWLREVVFQGVFGVDKAARIRVERGYCNLKLPTGIDPAHFQLLILAVLFPDQVPDALLAELADGDGSGLRLGLVVEVEARQRSVYKLFRRLEADSIVVKDVTDAAAEVPLASGLDEARPVLEERLFLPPPLDFQVLHLWRQPTTAGRAASSGHGAEIDRLLGLYRDAREIERLEQQLDELRSDLTEAERELNRLGAPTATASEREDRKATLASLAAVTPGDRAFVDGYETLLADLEDKQASRQMEADDSQRQSRPVPLKEEYVLWGAAGVALLFYVLSAATGVRALALVNVILLGVCASSLLRRFSRLEKVGFDARRGQQLLRRVEQVDEERQGLERRLAALLSSTASSDLGHLREQLAELGRVTRSRDEEDDDAMDEELSSHVASVQERLKGLRATFAEVERRKAAVPDCGMASYDLEQEFEERGVDPAQVETTGAASAPAERDWFVVGQQLAASRGLFVMGKLIEKATLAWSKLATLLAGPDWQGVRLSAEGVLLPPSTIDGAVQARFAEDPVEGRLLAWALLSAIFASTAQGHPLNQCRFLCVVDPTVDVPEAVGDRLGKVLQSLASQANVLVLRRG